MKNIRWNEQLKNRIISGGLSVVLVISGYSFGKLESKKDIDNTNRIVTESLDEYIKKRTVLEEEIEKLSKQKDRLKNSETFNISDLIVIETTNIYDESDLYILTASIDLGIFKEYNGIFDAKYNLHKYSEECVYSNCPEYVHFYEYKLLFDYLTEEEIEKFSITNGIVTKSEIDKILVRIREEYKMYKDKNQIITLIKN